MTTKKTMIRYNSKLDTRLKRAGAPNHLKFKQVFFFFLSFFFFVSTFSPLPPQVRPELFDKTCEGLSKLEQRDLRFRTHLTVGLLLLLVVVVVVVVVQLIVIGVGVVVFCCFRRKIFSFLILSSLQVFYIEKMDKHQTMKCTIINLLLLILKNF